MRRQNYGDKLNFAETLPDSSPDAAAAVAPLEPSGAGEPVGRWRWRGRGGRRWQKQWPDSRRRRRREPPELEKKVAAGAREARVSKGAVAAAVGAPAPETTGSQPRRALTSS